MCGIAGFTHRNEPAPEGVLRRAIASIHHRGPDQNGTFESPTVSLGAVRLKIQDLSGGDQPITDAATGTTIVFNGEVYNFRELRAELEGLGHAFHSHCDTEVVLRAFLQWDTASFTLLRGMFALALWQEPTRRLVLARDRMGIKPLYVHQRGSDLHFGSELKSLFAHPAVPRSLDATALNLFLRCNYIPTARTLASGITKLRPGCYLEWLDGATRVEPYWQLRFNARPRTFDDAKAELDHLLRESVREHLVSDVPLGVWLSGGLDSSAITHYASQLFPGNLKTFSVSFSGRSFDESPYFRTVAQHYATDHEEFDLHPEHDDLPAVIERLAHFSDEPSADAGALPVWYLSQMCRRQVTVALSGEGADELFGGYITYLADGYARTARPLPLTPLRLFARLLPVSDDKVSLEYKLRRFLDGASLPPLEAHLYWNGAFPKSHFPAPLPREWPLDGEAAPGPDGSFLHLDQLAYLPDDILNKCDRMSMAHSLEVRPAFLDHRIVEFAASLPHDLKIRGRNLKFVLRELMRDKLPPAVTKRSKQGFDIPTHHWFRTVLRPMLRDHVNEACVTAAGLSWPSIQQLLDEHDARKANHGYSLWGLLMLTLWIKEWKITR
ncbi:MAG: asparagine synthase (glutamine-hydrolyzing) [Acidobacteriota bacterium]